MAVQTGTSVFCPRCNHNVVRSSFRANYSFPNLSFGLVLVEKSENNASLGFNDGLGTTHVPAKLMSGAVFAWNLDGAGHRRTHVF